METANLRKLKIDQLYSHYELETMHLNRINNSKMDYKIFEKEGRVYFFEKIDDEKYRLYCITKKESFYL